MLVSGDLVLETKRTWSTKKVSLVKQHVGDTSSSHASLDNVDAPDIFTCQNLSASYKRIWTDSIICKCVRHYQLGCLSSGHQDE